MATASILWSFGAGIAVALSLVCGLIWLHERRELASLMLCILGVATAVSAFCELGLLRSETAAEFGERLRWYHLPVFCALLAQVLFIQYYLGTGRLWLMWAFIAMRSV